MAYVRRALFAAAAFATASVRAGYELVLFDDFNGDILNSSLWTVRTNMTHGATEWELYEAEECSVADSNLVLRTRFNPTYHGEKPYNFTSCWVDSLGKAAGELTYGRW